MIKYTKDGKKVKIIGELNSRESIVCEIYIKENGDEIPEGEDFTVKVSELFDEPIVSWAESQRNIAHDDFNKAKDKYSKDLKDLTEIKRKEERVLCAHIRSLVATRQKSESSDLDTLFDFLEGKITHVIVMDFTSTYIRELESEFVYDDIYSYGIKLLTLYGGHNQGLSWKLNQYNDGSGCGDIVIPCLSLEDAIAKLDKEFKKVKPNRVNQSHVTAKEKYNLQYPNDSDILEFYKTKQAQMTNSIQVSSEKTQKLETDLAKITLKLGELNG